MCKLSLADLSISQSIWWASCARWICASGTAYLAAALPFLAVELAEVLDGGDDDTDDVGDVPKRTDEKLGRVGGADAC